MPDDLDLRKLRYFAVLAEELHFGRAAERLHIAQPVLSRQIRALEHDLRVELFVRQPRGVSLAPAGVALVEEAASLLPAAEALRRRVRRAAGPQRRFVIGFMPGLVVTGPAGVLERAHPGLEVDVVRTGWADQTDVLHDGRADVSFVRLPVDAEGLEIRDLATERRVAVLPRDHALAGKDGYALADVAAEHLLQRPDAVPEWADVAAEMRRPGLRATGDDNYTVEEKLEHVARGRGIAVLPESVAVYYSRPDLWFAPVNDIGPSRIGLAWRASRRSELVAEFVRIAEDHGSPVAG